ncbi:MAG TPA: hypothetical protein VFX84_00775 [Candidatus Saccharimonadales bacterium]|nr:hypothetical protein [Candidatus Saccharimonadales bacterium]
MLILAHVLIAFSSMAWTTYLYLRPSRRKFHAAYGLIAATLISGTYLVISMHSPLLSSCITGLAYLSAVSAGVFAASRRQARQED